MYTLVQVYNCNRSPAACGPRPPGENGEGEALPEHGWLEGVELKAGEPGAPLQFRVQGVLPAQDAVSRYVRLLGRVQGCGDVRPGDSESLAAGQVPLVGFRVDGHHAAASGTPDQPRPGGAGYQSSDSTPPPTRPARHDPPRILGGRDGQR
ncbi:hypothetical protein [Longimicrobium terrae]|uniref:Uncharacterized protein n=1 Tax=Longimicrobium terrae TaxID=1639882 RepID=A0A841GRU3_9BACT|nr:hypothetical protein [Longimicrobium terrae]MBB4635966.1 hypothetical protein [Longimicrobium terrae]MBB6070362.1 hypothetical protein [Longimicrobium terrae]NNC30859.1 hypothetical protein [Longimicrobium terrae]